ncbi:hypothetical protein MKK70_25795 [Methylobacterium sp. E-041]|jgi:hypothetical protein|uniref:hypothetical protein n=1 Tax=unclassified Methylobacterium TaxID=2615210 RepID=UPI0011CB8E62|nr:MULTISPECIES: hypothetical protein [unclassified Methylobacterium]MCJ2010138.1 hypothetical protein [Methylobacterium sp. J-092]MCJ2038895.1 hypothetical protein [Methylobacterium sp. J-059]MCJ2078662.1 hypothetical protein [Methylobacterium sp. E-016]MCJ2108725.1 hypothetical protein [Methylobacterium sp. E-041]TXM91345.1 hypothetical protein FV223_15510 [Methylobacterium sp. WL116]
MSTTSVAPVLALVALLGFAAPTTASAAPATATVTKVAEVTPPVRPVSATEGEDDGGTCSRIRRRLWVEGEGWIVRRITTCR